MTHLLLLLCSDEVVTQTEEEMWKSTFTGSTLHTTVSAVNLPPSAIRVSVETDPHTVSPFSHPLHKALL